eukprot:997434_1
MHLLCIKIVFRMCPKKLKTDQVLFNCSTSFLNLMFSPFFFLRRSRYSMTIMSFALTFNVFIGMALCNQNYIFIEFTATDCSSDCFEIINPNFNITVYGYDPNMADVSASIITRQSFTADQVPFALNITLPQDTYTLIDPPTDTNSAKYYLHLNWDSDGNGQRCEGDLSFNYDALFPTVDVTTLQKQTLYLTTIPSTTPCTVNTNATNSEYIFIEFASTDCASNCFDIANPNFDITLYGYDTNMADGSASVITEQSFTAHEVPFEFNMTLPHHVSVLIDPLSDASNAKYYLHLDWDSDDNGQRCEGDLSFDYDALWPNVDVTTAQKQTLYLTIIPNSTPCTSNAVPCHLLLIGLFVIFNSIFSGL